MKKKHCDITERDYLLMRFLWKWKAVSTQALAKRFFPTANAYTAYRRLLHLETDGFIGAYPVQGRFNEAWILKEKGFHVTSVSNGHDAIESAKAELFDIVFLDPPFGSGLMATVLEHLDTQLAAHAVVYAEWSEPIEAVLSTIPQSGWLLAKQGRAGAVHFGLLSIAKGAA